MDKKYIRREDKYSSVKRPGRMRKETDGTGFSKGEKRKGDNERGIKS